MSILPRVTVIVPVWNEAQAIGECLTALLAQDYPRDLYDVCVVDNGSTDATPDVVRRFAGVTLLHEPAPGSYAARNRGLAFASGDYVAFTDADCIPDPGWLSAGIRAALAHPDAALVGGRIDLFVLPGASPVAAEFERLYGFKQEAMLAIGQCVTANWLSPTGVLKAIGGFDARLRSGGDFDLSRRLKAAGATHVYAPDMIVRHPHRVSVAALATKRRRTSAGAWQRHPEASDRLRFFVAIPIVAVRHVGSAFRAPGIPFRVRCGVAATVLWLSAVQFVQAVRMLAGATAPRS